MKYCTHLSRAQAERVTEPTDAALISITSPGFELAKIHLPAWQDVLRIQFDDIEADHPRYWADGYIPPGTEHAGEIAAFIRRYERQSIVVHCEAGISRSAAVCAVLCGLGGKYVKPHDDGLSRANTLLLGRLRREMAGIPIEGICLAQ